MSPELIINTDNLRARDELVNRAFKEFGTEHVPFKQDMDTPIIPVTWYPTTFRRQCLDIAGRIARTAGRTVLKITATPQNNLRFQELWKRSVEIPPIE